MNRIYKICIYLVVLATPILVSGTQIVRAQDDGTERLRAFTEQSAKNTEIRSKLCERYASGRFASNFITKEEAVTSAFEEREADLLARRNESDAKRIEAHRLADEKRQEHYAKLLAVAADDEQKAAIAEFQKVVESAVSSRRASFDAAREAYRSGVDALITQQRATYRIAMADLKLATEAAISNARQSCEDGAPSSEVSATLKAELAGAKETYRLATKNRTSLREDMAVLRETRKTSFDIASTTFKSDLDKATEELRKYIGDDEAVSE